MRYKKEILEDLKKQTFLKTDQYLKNIRLSTMKTR